jgi:hypothetical protein
MRTKALSPNQQDRKVSDHSEQGNASQMPKRIRNITKMKATQHRLVGKAINPGTSKVRTMKLSSSCMKQVPQSRGLDQLDFTPMLKRHQM